MRRGAKRPSRRFAEQEDEAGKVVAERFDAIGLAADEPDERFVDRALAARGPVI
jgi:hypothetical protein